MTLITGHYDLCHHKQDIRSQWNDIFEVLRVKRILVKLEFSPTKISFENVGQIKCF